MGETVSVFSLCEIPDTSVRESQSRHLTTLELRDVAGEMSGSRLRAKELAAVRVGNLFFASSTSRLLDASCTTVAYT